MKEEVARVTVKGKKRGTASLQGLLGEVGVDSASFTSNTGVSTKGKRRGSKKAKQSANLNELPIITKEGHGALAVGATYTSVGPSLGVIPVFALPSVNGDASFVNRIPRNPNLMEVEARRREKEEMLIMQQQLGLTAAEMDDLENELGGQSGSGSNEIERFLKMQRADTASGGPVPTLSLKATRREQQRAEVAEAALLIRRTPRCLGLGVSSTAADLRIELGESIHSMQALTGAVKSDVIAIQKLCKITGSHGNASKYMKSWAVERVVGILQDMVFSYIAGGFEVWRETVRKMKKEEKMEK